MKSASKRQVGGGRGMARMASAARRLALALPLAVLASCGGGGSSDVAPPSSCAVADQKTWLGDYMNEWYFWYRLAPQPQADGYATVGAYFDALLYRGTDAAFPADRWSRYESTESFNRFFGDGATMGYGLSVNGLEAVATPGTPLYVRYIEPLSDAAAQGVQRGDQVLSLNGVDTATLVAGNDFALLTAEREQQQLTLRLRRNGIERTAVVTSKIFNLTPVAAPAVYTTQGGRKLGYVAVKDMISQAQAGLDAAFASLRAQGAQDLALDLRYNGGGLVSVGGVVASLVAGVQGAGRPYATLLYNDKRAAANNQTFTFSNMGNAMGLSRVFVLTGQRTCSASEQVLNGLRGVGVEVIAVGDTTCGKPVGFLPTSQCGSTYSVVNFESVNARNEGRYFSGMTATCPVAENWTIAQGAASDPLVAAASWYADNGRCGPTAALGATQREGGRPRLPGWVSDERTGMLAR